MKEVRPLRAYAEVALGRQRSPQHDQGPHMVPYLRAANVKDGRLDLTDVKEMNFTPAEQGIFSLRSGDVLVSEGSGSLGSVGASAVWSGEIGGLICFQNTLLRLRPRERTDPRFLAWWCRFAFADGLFASIATGANIFHLSADRVRSLPMTYLPLGTQREIVDFLDAETARIDALIAKRRRQLDLLQERFRSLVDVTTGDGRLVRARHVTSLITSGPRGWASHLGDQGVPFLRSANLSRESIDIRGESVLRVEAAPTAEALRSRVQEGDSLVGITGANTGWVALVRDEDAPAYVSQHVAILRPNSINSVWLAYSLFSRRIQEHLLAGQYGGTKTQLGLQDLADLPIAVPPHEVQQERVAILQQASRNLTKVSDCLEEQISLLVERRQALITAAVTGELDVTARAS